jgi:cyanuric acid amidohydrolase
MGKTEGNGLVNDFSRGYGLLALSLLFQRHLPADKFGVKS